MEHDLFSVYDYTQMVKCAPRARAYAGALKRYVTPGCTVIDIGAGTGFFSILACQYGAGRVIAIEPNNVIEIAKKSAKTNGCDDRIEFFKGFSQDYKTNVKADIIVSDLRGAMPLYRLHIPAIIDARERLLAKNGILLPQKDTICVALAQVGEADAVYKFLRQPNEYGLDLLDSYETVINSPRWFFSKPEHICPKPQIFTHLDYAAIVDPNVKRELSFPITQPGKVNGLMMWFDAQIAPDLSYSNGPEETERQYRSQFLPFEDELDLEEGDVFKVTLSATLIGGSYVWSWDSHLIKSGSDTSQISFKQSSFLGGLFKNTD